LAKKSGHREVYAIDASAPFEMDTVVKVAQKYQFTPFLQMLEKMPSFMQDENKKLHESA